MENTLFHEKSNFLHFHDMLNQLMKREQQLAQFENCYAGFKVDKITSQISWNYPLQAFL